MNYLHSQWNTICKRPGKYIYEKSLYLLMLNVVKSCLTNLCIISTFTQRKTRWVPMTRANKLNYLECIKRCISECVGAKINILHDAVFRANGKIYLNVADNLSAKQKSEVVRTKPYDTLTDRDGSTIMSYDSKKYEHSTRSCQ